MINPEFQPDKRSIFREIGILQNLLNRENIDIRE